MFSASSRQMIARLMGMRPEAFGTRLTVAALEHLVNRTPVVDAGCNAGLTSTSRAAVTIKAASETKPEEEFMFSFSTSSIRQFLTLTTTLATTLAACSTSHAYFSVVDTGELIEQGQYQVTLEPQLILNNYDGFNLIGHFDTGIDQDSGARVTLGFGKVDYQVGGFYKYVPFPDTAKQPAIGGSAGVVMAKVNGVTMTSLRLKPLVSKKLQTEIGDLIPYASLPFGITFTSNQTTVPVQLVVGSEVKPMNMENISFFGEIGVNISKAFGYLSGAAAYRF